MIVEAGLKTLCVAAFALFAVSAIAISPEPAESDYANGEPGYVFAAVSQS